VELALGASALEGRPALSWLAFAAHHVGLAALLGVGIGLAGGWAVGVVQRREPLATGARAIGGAGLAVLALAAAGALGASGPAAAFVAGLTIARVAPRLEEGVSETDPYQGSVLFVLAFVTLGATLVPEALERASWRTAVFAAASLTAVRALPVFLSFMGSGLPARDVAYVAWFGPRGLAAILIARVLVERSDLPGREVALVAIVTTVAASVVLHGLTAAPLGRWRARPGQQPEGLVPRKPAEVPP
jgi:NhaP-type Na+/H+ or K+/H+ antiporter